MMRSVLLVFLVFLQSACEQTPKYTYLLADPLVLHTIEATDSSTFAYLDLDNDQFGEVNYRWSAPSNDDLSNIPSDLATSNFLVEENSLETSKDGYFRARYYSQAEDGSWILLGFRTSKGNYWIQSSEDKSYGLIYLSKDLLVNHESVTVDGSILSCIKFVCNNVGNIGWQADYVNENTKETPYGNFDNYKITLNHGSVLVNTTEDSFSYSFYEGMSVYPPVGIIHRELEQSPDIDGNSIYIDMKLGNTNIVIPDSLVQQ